MRSATLHLTSRSCLLLCLCFLSPVAQSAANPSSTAQAASEASAASARPLQADELLLVFNGNDPRSRELAEYYAQVRQVPVDRLCPVQVMLNKEEISRYQYEQQIRNPVRRHLEEQPFAARIRCIVLFYGMPIRVGPKIVNAAEAKLAQQWRDYSATTLAKLEQAVEMIEALTTDQPVVPSSTSRPAAADDQQIAQVLQRYQRAVEAAWTRVMARMSLAEGQEEYRRLSEAIQTAEGVVGVLARSKVKDPTPQTLSVIEKYINQARAAESQAAELRRRDLTDPVRESARELILRNHGLIGLLSSLHHDIAMTRVEETTASVDSELTLLLWDPYVPYRWINNSLSWDVRAQTLQAKLKQQKPVLMTCRIDGPSLDACRRIIDQSIAAERTGLTGKVYFDARGLNGKSGHGSFDVELRQFADLLRRETKLDVHLDNRPQVFGPGECPDAMLYCGWYSLRKYVPAFQFVPGAVGYHVASFEAISLKSPAERGWVRNLLKDGIDATMGPVAEPYLHSFPKPKQFFGLLLTGQFSLAECYAYTNELNSWMMLLIGDPLYRPFARNPHLRLDQVYPPERIPPEYRIKNGDG